MGEKQFAVLWNALTLDTVDQPSYPEHRWGIYSYILSIGYIVPLEVTIMAVSHERRDVDQY